jgi:hypothetical protein
MHYVLSVARFVNFPYIPEQPSVILNALEGNATSFVVYFMKLSVSHTTQRRMVGLRGFGMKWSWPNQDIISIFA